MIICERHLSGIIITEQTEKVRLHPLDLMDIYTIVPTSPNSADGDPIVLRESSTTRLVFKPRIVRNFNDPEAVVGGCFVFQRKSRSDQWEDHNEVPLNKLKATEWVKLDLDSSELMTLLHDVAGLFRERQRNGIPRTRTYYLKVATTDQELPDLVNLDIRRFIRLSQKAGIDVLAEVLEWMSNLDDPAEVVGRLQELDVSSLQRINAVVGITALQSLLGEWEDNAQNGNEEFWQKLFEENAFALTQLFPYPLLVLQQKAYVGGKQITNEGGNLADFLAANPLTRNATIIEIKTPSTPLIGGRYRDHAYGVSAELAGTIAQVLNYRYHLMTEYLSLQRSGESFQVYAPQCLVIAGNVSEQLKNDDQRRSFETFRSSLKDIIVIGYDELFAKLRALLNALEGPNRASK